MSKKQQNNKGKVEDQKIVDEQKEPCLRALQKKVRNVNKKLTQIAELASKDNLKPQQLEKINRKQSIVEEKDKYLEFIQIYKTIITENQKAIRKNQLSEIEDIAMLVAVKEYGYMESAKDVSEVNQLLAKLQNPAPQKTLKQRVNQLSQCLINLADNTKLKQRFKKNYEEHQQHKIKQKVVEVVHKGPIKSQEEKIQIKKQPQIKAPTPIKAKEEPPKEEIQEKPQKLQEVCQNKQKQTVEEKPKEDQEKGQKKQNKKKQYYKNKNFKKHTYKPKYQQKTKEEEQQNSDEETSQIVAAFKRDEIKKLEDEGFTVVGKPKTKPRQFKDNSHQNGRKQHQYNYHRNKN